MKRTILKTTLKHRCEARKEFIICVSLVRKAKKEYFYNFDHKMITDNESF